MKIAGVIYMGRNLSLFMSLNREQLQWMATSILQAKSLPLFPCSKCLMPQVSHDTGTCQLVFQVVPTRKQRLQWGMLTARNSDWLERLLVCRATARLWGSPPTSPGAASPLVPKDRQQWLKIQVFQYTCEVRNDTRDLWLELLKKRNLLNN